MPSIQAQKCVAVVSSWVRYFILTCDNKLAVQFYDSHHPYHPKKTHPRPDVCCYYPNTDAEYFNLALVWGSAGKFVHRFLYRKMPYLLVKSPCPAAGCGVQTSCCANAVPLSLTGTLTGDPGGCSGSYPFVYDPGPGWWTWSGTLGHCTGTQTMTVLCHGGQWQFLGEASLTLAGATCDPFSLTFTGTSPICCGNNTLTLTITP